MCGGGGGSNTGVTNTPPPQDRLTCIERPLTVFGFVLMVMQSSRLYLFAPILRRRTDLLSSRCVGAGSIFPFKVLFSRFERRVMCGAVS